MADEIKRLRLRSWRPELPDHRDYRFNAARSSLRARVEPMSKATGLRIHDQGYTSSCTGHAATNVLEMVLKRKGDAEQLSRLFPYYLGREAIGEADRDEGAYNRDVIKAMMSKGVPPESSWRFAPAQITRAPTATAYKRAEQFRAQVLDPADLLYERCDRLPGLLGALSDGHPVLFGFMAFPAIFDLNRTNDILPLPTEQDVPSGGHAVAADGYSMDDRLVDVVNSWGDKWGNRGRFRMPFEWFTDARQLTDDLWTIRPRASTPAP